MSWKWVLCACVAFGLSCALYSDQPEDAAAVEIPEDFTAMRLNSEDTPRDQSAYLEAYVQGILDAKFPESKVTCVVRNGTILLSNLPKDPAKAKEIEDFVRAFSAESSVLPLPPAVLTHEAPHETAHCVGMWLPQSTILFPTQVANPRQICFSLGERFNDPLTGPNSTPVSFGDQFPLYRWSNVWGWRGDLQLELEGGVFAVFNQDNYSSPLINADYYVGVPFSYAIDKAAYRLRFYHISSHLGDEEMMRRHDRGRKNKSFEAVDFWGSYYIVDDIRVYGGIGVIARSDPEMPLKRLYVEYGVEARAWRKNFTELYGQPFLAMHFQNFEETRHKMDATFALGYEWGKLYGIGRKIRLYAEYHEGYSQEGQFCRRRADYFQIKLAYGF